MGEVMEFAAREDFRAWLSENCLTSGGVWLLFGIKYNYTINKQLYIISIDMSNP